MPFASPAIFSLLASEDAGAGAIPVWGARLQPLHGVYRSDTSRHAEDLVKGGETSARGLAVSLGVHLVSEQALRPIDPEGLFCFNVNTPGNLDVARTLIEEGA
jgi:molybdopterin-guanine dinucleotide biosynthesis protein A